MGSGGSSAAQIPDADNIRRETGCELGARGSSGVLREAGWRDARAQEVGAVIAGPGTRYSWGPASRFEAEPGPELGDTQGSSSPDGRGWLWSLGLPEGSAGAQSAFSGLVTPLNRPLASGLRRNAPSASPQPPPPTGPPGCHASAFPPTVSQASLLRLYHRFRALDSNKKGYLR